MKPSVENHHLLCMGVMAQCYEHVPESLQNAIYEGIEQAINLGFKLTIPEEWQNPPKKENWHKKAVA